MRINQEKLWQGLMPKFTISIKKQMELRWLRAGAPTKSKEFVDLIKTSIRFMTT